MIPHPIYGKCTKADGSAYTGRVWLRNMNTNQRVDLLCNSLGEYVFDLANMDSYAEGDVLIVAIEAFGKPGFLLTRNPIEDSPVDTIEPSDGQRLNTATLTINFKISYGVSKDKARVEVFHNIWNLLEKDPPTYTDRDGVLKTYEIVSAFPEITPVFPCIVVNPIDKDVKRLGVDKRANLSFASSIKLDFYAKTSDGKNAIDSAKDKVETIILNNWVTETVTVAGEAGQQVDIQGVE